MEVFSPARFHHLEPGGGEGANRWYLVALREGRNREVRRLWASQGLVVSRLKRVRYGAAFLPKRLLVGKWYEVEPRDHEVLREDVGLPAKASGLSLQGLRGKVGGPPAKRPGNKSGKRPGVRPRKKAPARRRGR